MRLAIFCIMLLLTTPIYAEDKIEISKKCANWLLSVQNEDGGWGRFEGSRSRAEQTAIVVKSLTKLYLNTLDKKYLEKAEEGTRWLFEHNIGGFRWGTEETMFWESSLVGDALLSMYNYDNSEEYLESTEKTIEFFCKSCGTKNIKEVGLYLHDMASLYMLTEDRWLYEKTLNIGGSLLKVQTLDGGFPYAALNDCTEAKISELHSSPYSTPFVIVSMVDLFKISRDFKYLSAATAAGDYLVNAQKENGSWMNDMDVTSNCASALLYLYEVTVDQRYLISVKNGVNYLIDIQKDGIWFDEKTNKPRIDKNAKIIGLILDYSRMEPEITVHKILEKQVIEKGEIIGVHIEVRNHKGGRVNAVVMDEKLPAGLTRIGTNYWNILLGPYDAEILSYRIKGNQRGSYILKPVRVDYTFLDQKNTIESSKISLIVSKAVTLPKMRSEEYLKRLHSLLEDAERGYDAADKRIKVISSWGVSLKAQRDRLSDDSKKIENAKSLIRDAEELYSRSDYERIFNLTVPAEIYLRKAIHDIDMLSSEVIEKSLEYANKEINVTKNHVYEANIAVNSYNLPVMGSNMRNAISNLNEAKIYLQNAKMSYSKAEQLYFSGKYDDAIKEESNAINNAKTAYLKARNAKSIIEKSKSEVILAAGMIAGFSLMIFYIVSILLIRTFNQDDLQ